MVVIKRKKFSRMRATTTHGYGSRKKHRGAGSRGGRGMAGTGKRADAKKPSIWKDTKYFGKYGFRRNVRLKKINTVNVSDIEKKLDFYVEKKLIEKKSDTYIIDLNKLGFQKLLGDGKATKKLKITAQYASKKAVEKVKKAGGEVILPKEGEKVEPNPKSSEKRSASDDTQKQDVSVSDKEEAKQKKPATKERTEA